MLFAKANHNNNLNMTYPKFASESSESHPSSSLIPCIGHSLVPRSNRLVPAAKHTKSPKDATVLGKPRACRRALVSQFGPPLDPVGNTIIIFGGHDMRSLLHDLNIFDLRTVT